MAKDGIWPDMSKILSSSAALDESLSEYERRDNLSSCLRSQTAAASNVQSTHTGKSAVESSATDIQSEEDTDDDDEDEILAWVASGLLPANPETSLALNQAYQEILEQFVRRVESVLAQVRERQEAVQNLIDKQCMANAMTRMSKVQPSLYMNPYFRDSAEMCPPTNPEATKINEELNAINLLVEPPLKWSQAEEEKLTKAITEAIAQRKTTSAQNKMELINEKLQLATKKFDIKKLQQDLSVAEKDYKKVIKFADKDLPSDFDWNKIDWNYISVADFEGARKALECQLKWMNELRPGINRNSTWRKEELMKLKKLAEKYDGKNWDIVAQKLETNRTAFQCAEKYHSELNESLKKSHWTPEEDATLRESVEKVRMGDFIPWDQVLLFMDNRTRMQCKLRWIHVLQPDKKKGRWSDEEDLLLIEAIDKLGEKDWPKIATYVPGRTSCQCRERWHMCLKTNFKLGAWTKEEDATLLMGLNTFGASKWSSVCRLLPGRTANACKVHYRTLEKRGIKKVSERKDGDEKNEENLKVHSQTQRRQRVIDQYVENHGRPPKQVENDDTNEFIRSLPNQIQNVVRQKLTAIKTAYGTSTTNEESNKKIVDDDETQTKSRVAEIVGGIKSASLRKRKTPPESNSPVAKQSKTTDDDESRVKKVDVEIMTLLRNSIRPASNSYPFARFKKKEDSMRKTLAQCLLDKKILPASKSTLLGFKGLLLERYDLLAKAKHLNVVDPLVKESDQVLRGYFDDKEKPTSKKDDQPPVEAKNNETKGAGVDLDEIIPANSLNALINHASFVETEKIFRSMFLWPAIMSSARAAQNVDESASNVLKI